MERNVSQRELARLSGVSRHTILMAERGERQPTPATLLALSVALSCSPFDLVPEPPQGAAEADAR